MQWIECVERRNGALVVLVSHNYQDAPSWHPIDELKEFAPSANSTCRKRLTTDLENWKISSAKDYLTAIGDKHEPTEGQTVFSFHENGTEYLVPAIVIIQALFRPLRYLSPYLFHPANLALVSSPTSSSSEFAATLSLSSVNKRYSEPVATQSLFTWAWAFPTARRMWASLYQHALQGKLGVTLPMGTVRAVFRGVALGSQIAVTEMRVMQLTTTEQSDLEVPPATNTFILHSSAMYAPMPKCSAEEELIKRMNGVPRPLTDNEWASIQDVLNKRPKAHPKKLNQRDLLNGILAKLATGTPWRSVTYKIGDWHHASTTYRRWKTTGRWNEICSRLVPSSLPI